MRKTAIVRVQWNRWQDGAFRGVLMQVELEDVLMLDSPFADAGIKASLEGSCVVLGGSKAERFEIVSHREWVGNWCWDALRMRSDEAIRMINWLIGKWFRPECGEEHLLDIVRDGKQITFEDLKHV